jgi:UDP-3-O-acyl-N-acetylglucosamine deacetylase
MIDPGMQHTLGGEAGLEGVGFLSGRAVKVLFRPAEPDNGIVFVRTDTAGAVRIAADVRHVQFTPRRTTLCAEGVSVEMVEHVLAALAGLGIDNCEIHLDSAELPGGDGSARHFVDCLLEAGIVAQHRPRRVMVIDQPVYVGDRRARAAEERFGHRRAGARG